MTIRKAGKPLFEHTPVLDNNLNINATMTLVTVITIKTEIIKTTSAHQQHQRISSISTSAASVHQSISASAASAYQQHQHISSLSSISASASLAVSAHQRHQHISCISTSAHQQQQHLSSISASAALAHPYRSCVVQLALVHFHQKQKNKQNDFSANCCQHRHQQLIFLSWVIAKVV